MGALRLSGNLAILFQRKLLLGNLDREVDDFNTLGQTVETESVSVRIVVDTVVVVENVEDAERHVDLDVTVSVIGEEGNLTRSVDGVVDTLREGEVSTVQLTQGESLIEVRNDSIAFCNTSAWSNANSGNS